MKAIQAVTATAFFCLALAQVSLAAEFNGSWTLAPSEAPGKVQFAIQHRHKGGSFMSQNDWPVDAFQGVDLKAAGRRDVEFAIVRDAGRIDCEGYLKDGHGAGTFTFTPDADYMPAMDALGFGGVSEDKQFAMMIHDVTLAYAKQMKAENLDGLTTDKLLAFAIFNVTRETIRDLRAEGLAARNVDKLIAFHVHGIKPEFVRDVRKSGLKPNEDQLVAMKIHGVTPEYVAEVQKMGFAHPSADELVAMRIHDVSPEYIASMKSRGLKDLTINKLVQLKLHGIE